MADCKWLVEISISDEWINDGFTLEPKLDILKDAIDERLFGGLTTEGELTVTIKKSPTAKQIKAAENRIESSIQDYIRNDK